MVNTVFIFNDVELISELPVFGVSTVLLLHCPPLGAVSRSQPAQGETALLAWQRSEMTYLTILASRTGEQLQKLYRGKPEGILDWLLPREHVPLARGAAGTWGWVWL